MFKSHDLGTVKWESSTDEEIEAGRTQDRLNKERFYSQNKSASAFKETKPFGSIGRDKIKSKGLFQNIKDWWSHKMGQSK